MDESTKRGREWDDRQCDEFAAFDASRDPKEFLPQIYREASNGDQHPANQIAKTLAKCSSLFVHLSSRQERVHRSIRYLTAWLVVLTVAIVGLTVVLVCYTAKLIQHEKEVNQHEHQSDTSTVQLVKPSR